MRIINAVQEAVEDACKAKTNIFGYSAWTHHILTVVKLSKKLAKEAKVDIELAVLAALFHDYASVKNKDWYPEHHIHSSRLAEEMLSRLKYPPEKIKQISEAIFTHRASKKIQRKTIYAEILANADAMAHFYNVDSLMYLVYVNKKMDVDEGKKFVLDKLHRSWEKLTPSARNQVRELFAAAKKLLR